jgi:hypothetical protein
MDYDETGAVPGAQFYRLHRRPGRRRDLAEAEGFELSLCLTLAMTRRVDSGELRF